MASVFVLESPNAAGVDVVQQDGQPIQLPAVAVNTGGVTGSDVVVYRSGGITAGIVVATEADLQAALTAGATSILVDSSLAPGGIATIAGHIVPAAGASISLGSYFAATLHDEPGSPGTTGSDILKFLDGATITNVARITQGLWVQCVAATVIPFLFTGDEAQLTQTSSNVQPLTNGGVPIASAGAGLVLLWVLTFNAKLLGATGVAAIEAAGGVAELVMFGDAGGNINATSIGSTSGTAAFSYDATATPPTFSIGSVLILPSSNDSSLVFGVGTAFPVTPAPRNGARFVRTDLGLGGTLYVFTSAGWVPASQLIQFEFDTTSTFTVLPGVIAILADAVGGGGGGGGGASGDTASETIAGGGGAGGGARKSSGVLTAVGGDILTITIGAGGAGGAAGEPGANGGDTTITNGSSSNGLWAPGASGGDAGPQSGLGGAPATAGPTEATAFQLSTGYGSQSAYVKLLASVGISIVNGGAGLNALGFDNIGDVKFGGAGGGDGAPAAANAGGGGGGGGNAGEGGGSNATTPDGGAGGAGNAAGIGGNGSPGNNGPVNSGSGGGGGGAGGSGSVSGGPGSNGGNGGSGFVRLTLVL